MAINGIVNPNAVASAYSNSQSITGASSVTKLGSPLGDVASASDVGNSNAPSFAEFMANNIEKSISTMKSGEEMSARAVTGEASVTDIVQAVTDAELTLQTVVSVRDKMISSYQNIMRMPI